MKVYTQILMNSNIRICMNLKKILIKIKWIILVHGLNDLYHFIFVIKLILNKIIYI